MILYFLLIWLKSMFADSNQASLNRQREAFLCPAGRHHCAEGNSSRRYLLKGKDPTVPSKDRTSGFLLKSCTRLCSSLCDSLAFIILWGCQDGHSAHNAPRALLLYVCKLNFTVELIRCHEEYENHYYHYRNYINITNLAVPFFL